MQTDRELLELAAKAIGGRYHWQYRSDAWSPHHLVLLQRTAEGVEYGPPIFNGTWNPLTDDGDALRLAVTLGIRVTPPKYKGFGTSAEPQNGATGCTVFRDDPMEQTRRAIVMAASEIGAKTHPKQHNDGGAVYE